MTVERGTLAFRGSALTLSLHDGAAIDSALEFLASHFSWTGETYISDPVADVHVYPAGTPLSGWPENVAWEDIFVRKSASPFFTIPATRARIERDEYVDCVATGTSMAFHPAQGRIDVALPAAGYLDFVERVRDLVLKDQENRGVLVLHATSAERDGSLAVISGSKGAGKSTILLELVEHFGFRVVAGDTTLAFVDESGDVILTGWPDYPHLGFGTIDRYPGLLRIAGIPDDYVPATEQVFSPLGKFAVDFTGFRVRFPGAARGFHSQPAEIILPNIGPGETTEVRDIGGSVGDRRRLLNANLESAFAGAHAGWQSFSENHTGAHAAAHDAIITALCTLPMREITGPGDLRGSAYAPV